MKVRLLKFFTILAMAVVLFAMVSCAEEPAPATPDAQIPSEDGGSAKNFDASDAQTVQKVFSDLVDFITKLSDSSKDAEEKKTTYVANGSLIFSNPYTSTVQVEKVTGVDDADIRYTGFAGSATLTGNELTATIDYSASIKGGAATAYKIVINDFELDEFVLYKGDGEAPLDKKNADNTNDYYYAKAVFVDAISHLQAKFENASVTITTPDDVEINLEIKGSFNVSLIEPNLDVILNDGDGNPFSEGSLHINMDLGVTVVSAGQTINGSVGLKNLNVAIKFDGKEEEKGTTTTTTNIITFGVNYKSLSVRANYADSIILNVESEVKNDRDEAFILDIITTKVEDSADHSKDSSSTKFNVDLGSRVGVGLYVEGNSIGLLADAEIDVANKTFKELDLDNDLTVTPKAALVNGKYVNPFLFYECIKGVIESMDDAE